MQCDCEFNQYLLWDYEIQPCIFLTHHWSCWVRVNSVFHAVPTVKSAEWQQYCAGAFILQLLSCFYLFTIYSSHLYWLEWVFQMPVDRYLQRSEWLFVPYRAFCIYTGRVYFNLFRESGSWRPYWSGQSEIDLLLREVSSLTIYSKITHNYKLPNICCYQQVHLCVFLSPLALPLVPMTSTADFPHLWIKWFKITMRTTTIKHGLCCLKPFFIYS